VCFHDPLTEQQDLSLLRRIQRKLFSCNFHNRIQFYDLSRELDAFLELESLRDDKEELAFFKHVIVSCSFKFPQY
jgi:hypothetical protein